MADTKINKNNETMQREQAKASVAGDRKPEHKSDEDRREQARLDKEGREKSAIGGGAKSSQPGHGTTGQGMSGQSGQNREFDKSRTEPTSR